MLAVLHPIPWRFRMTNNSLCKHPRTWELPHWLSPAHILEVRPAASASNPYCRPGEQYRHQANILQHRSGMLFHLLLEQLRDTFIIFHPLPTPNLLNSFCKLLHIRLMSIEDVSIWGSQSQLIKLNTYTSKNIHKPKVKICYDQSTFIPDSQQI